ncbi:MAG TPA: ScpA family protein [Acidimicrobiales bacterium]|jgi:segregation and condensation protein A
MAVEVSTPVFQGPFDLLLDLILRDTVDLYDVSLSTIVDAYLAEVERLGRLDLEIATEFLLIAAVLVELKTKRLLPIDDDIDLDDELGLWEERDLLLSRLLECKTFKDAGRELRRLADLGGRVAPRLAGPEDHFLHLAPDVLERVEPHDLRSAFLRAMVPRPEPRVSLEHITIIRASVTDAVAELLDELPRAGRLSFRAICAGLVDRIEVVVRFLALLELYKQDYVDLRQASSFGELVVVWTGGAEVPPAADLVGAEAYDG